LSQKEFNLQTGETNMKLRIGGLMFVLFSLVLPMAAQDSSTTSNPAYKKIVWNNTTVKLNGPKGTTGDAPTVLSVTGGTGALGAAGSGIQLTAGAGGPGFYGGVEGGNGGSITLTAGQPGYCVCGSGDGGSITLQPGDGGHGGIPGNIILALQGGNFGVGNNSPAATLDVVAGGTTLADAWTTRSSRRFKTNIQPLEGALEKVEQLQGVSYDRKADGKHEIGVVAEDVDQVVPEVVSRDPKSQEVQGVDYSRLAALLIEAVKTQQAEIQQLRAQVLQLTADPVPRAIFRGTQDLSPRVRTNIRGSALGADN
jgi:hypothetical protein